MEPIHQILQSVLEKEYVPPTTTACVTQDIVELIVPTQHVMESLQQTQEFAVEMELVHY